VGSCWRGEAGLRRGEVGPRRGVRGMARWVRDGESPVRRGGSAVRSSRRREAAPCWRVACNEAWAALGRQHCGFLFCVLRWKREVLDVKASRPRELVSAIDDNALLP
jgi:hypothetical protein